jgi:hypothetical protein
VTFIILYPFSVRYVCKLDSWAHILWSFSLTLKPGVTRELPPPLISPKSFPSSNHHSGASRFLTTTQMGPPWGPLAPGLLTVHAVEMYHSVHHLSVSPLPPGIMPRHRLTPFVLVVRSEPMAQIRTLKGYVDPVHHGPWTATVSLGPQARGLGPWDFLYRNSSKFHG